MKLTIIGCGWFGLPMAQRGVELGWEVHGSVRDAQRAQELRAHGFNGFALDLSDVHYPQVPFTDAHVVVAVPPGFRATTAAFYESGVQRLVEHAAAHQAKAFVLISSTSVYDGFAGEVAEFTEPQNADRVLVRVERMLAAQDQIPACAVRFAGLIGPDRHPGRYLAGRRDLPNGDHPVNLVHQRDCVAAVELLLKTELDKWPRVVNVVSPEHPARRDYYPSAAVELGLEPPTFLPDSYPDGGRIVRCGWLDLHGFAFTGIDP